MSRPYGLLAELTHRCPLRCPYCSNPLELAARREELPPAEWQRVLAEAAALGVVQVGFSGGEPLLYEGLELLIETARREGMYSNLITSAVGLTPARAARLRAAGLDAVQISLQADEAEVGDAVAGARVHAAKLAAAAAVRDAGLPLGLNVVLHAGTIDRLDGIIRLAESLGAIRLELANVQFYGWAHANRAALLPTREQVDRAAEVVAAHAERLGPRLALIYVLPDYHERRPKPCLHGWGSRALTVNPRGDVLPCQAANAIPDLEFPNVRDHDLAWIWRESAAFNRFRGFEWMPEPCRSCPERERDFGGCRCQAALLTGDATRTDPVCEFAPDRGLIDAVLAAPAAPGDWRYRPAAGA